MHRIAAVAALTCLLLVSAVQPVAAENPGITGLTVVPHSPSEAKPDGSTGQADVDIRPVDPATQPNSGPSTKADEGRERARACRAAAAGKQTNVDIRGCAWPATPSTIPAPGLPTKQNVLPSEATPVPTAPAVVTSPTGMPVPPSPDAESLAQIENRVTELRTKAQDADRLTRTAQDAAASAEETARRTEWEAVMAGVAAEGARGVISRHAAGMYRTSGGNASSVIAIVNSTDGDPGTLLDDQSYLQKAGEGKEVELEQAANAVAEARNLQKLAQAARTEAADALTAADTARESLAVMLTEAETELAVVRASAVSSQTLIGADGCPTQVPGGTLRGSAAGLDIHALCARNVAAAHTPEAALAIKFAFRSLGAPYACGGVGRSLPFRFDCSSLVSRAYSEGAGLRTAGDGWAPSTRDMVPWDGVPLAPWADAVAPEFALPGDLILYDTGGALYRHVVMLLADGLMLHTNSCGDVAKIEDSWGFGTATATYLVTRRVNPGAAR